MPSPSEHPNTPPEKNTVSGPKNSKNTLKQIVISSFYFRCQVSSISTGENRLFSRFFMKNGTRHRLPPITVFRCRDKIAVSYLGIILY